LFLEPSNPAPVSNIVVLNPGHDDFEDTSAEVVRKEHVGVDLVEPGDKGLEYLLLVVEDADHTVLLWLQLLSQVEGPRLSVQFPHDCKLVQFLSIGRPVLVDLAVNQATNHCNFVRVVGRSGRLETERKRRHGRRLSVHIIDCLRNVLGATEGQLLLAPGVSEVGRPLKVLDF